MTRIVSKSIPNPSMKQVDQPTFSSKPPQVADEHSPFFSPPGTASSRPFFSPPIIQSKLEIGSPDDEYEQEAEERSERVVQHMTSPTLTAPASIQRKCSSCEDEEKLRRKETDSSKPSASPSIASQITDSTGSGYQLQPRLRSEMESAFQNDFSGVRLHTDSQAVQLSQTLNAQAFTYGNDIYFNAGKYNTDSTDGKRLLAHELTHVVQQGAGIQRKKIQRQHLWLVNDRYVGDLDGETTNIREDVLRVMDKLHVLWSLPDADYAAEYPTVQGMAGRSHISVANLPNTIRAIRRNEENTLHRDVANGVFGLTLTDHVGRGERNNKSDIFLLQDLLHRGWHLTSPAYAAERSAVNSGPDPVPEGLIPQTIQGIGRLKTGYVAGTTHLHLAGPYLTMENTRAVDAPLRTQVERALVTPGSSTVPGATTADPFINVVAGKTYWEDLIAALDRYRASEYPRSSALLGGTRIPMSRFDEISVEAKAQVDNVFGSYATGPSLVSTSVPPTLVDRSTVTPSFVDLLTYLINNSDNLEAVRRAHKADHSRPTEEGLVRALIFGCTGADPWCPNAFVPGAPATLIRYIDRSPTNRTQLEVIDQAWPGVTTPGVQTEIQPFSTGSNAGNRRMFWDQFETVLHEYIHFIEHPAYRRFVNSLSPERRSVLVEGGTSLLTDNVWQGLYPTRIRSDTRLRQRVEGPLFTPVADLHFVPLERSVSPATSVGNYPSQMRQVRQIINLIGNQNFRAAYFLGQTQYLGFPPASVGGSTFVVPPSGVRTLADVAFMTGIDVETIARLNTMPVSQTVTSGQPIHIQ